MPFVLLLLLSAPGCQKKESPPALQPNVESAHSRPESHRKEAKVVVPPEVAKRWKTVRIAVVDKTNVTQKTYTVPVGGKLALPSSGMTLEVEAFLPAFIMEGALLTSSSNEPTNPAAKIRITENGMVIFKGWLFSKYPNTHAFMNPRYGFSLLDETPAGK